MNPKEKAESYLYPFALIATMISLILGFVDSLNNFALFLQQNYYLALTIIYLVFLVVIFRTDVTKYSKLFRSKNQGRLIIIALFTLLYFASISFRYHETKIKSTYPASPPRNIQVSKASLLNFNIWVQQKTFTVENFYLEDELCTFIDGHGAGLHFENSNGQQYRTFYYNYMVTKAFSKANCIGVEGNLPSEKVTPILKENLIRNNKQSYLQYLNSPKDLRHIILNRGDIFKEIFFTAEDLEYYKKNESYKYDIILNWLVNCVGLYNPIFTIVIRNDTERNVIISKVEYIVERLDIAYGGETGLIVSQNTYEHFLRYETGIQENQLIPNFLLAPYGVGSFRIKLTPYEDILGQTWIMKIRLYDTDGNYDETDIFRLVMTKK